MMIINAWLKYSRIFLQFLHWPLTSSKGSFSSPTSSSSFQFWKSTLHDNFDQNYTSMMMMLTWASAAWPSPWAASPTSRPRSSPAWTPQPGAAPRTARPNQWSCQQTFAKFQVHKSTKMVSIDPSTHQLLLRTNVPILCICPFIIIDRYLYRFLIVKVVVGTYNQENALWDFVKVHWQLYYMMWWAY